MPVSPKELLEHALQGGAYRERLALKQISAEVLQPPLASRGLLLRAVPVPLRAPCGEVVEEIRDLLANPSPRFRNIYCKPHRQPTTRNCALLQPPRLPGTAAHRSTERALTNWPAN